MQNVCLSMVFFHANFCQWGYFSTPNGLTLNINWLEIQAKNTLFWHTKVAGWQLEFWVHAIWEVATLSNHPSRLAKFGVI